MQLRSQPLLCEDSQPSFYGARSRIAVGFARLKSVSRWIPCVICNSLTMSECPLANLEVEPSQVTRKTCPFHQHNKPHEFSMLDEVVPLATRGGSHAVSAGTIALLQDIGGGDRIREFCSRFYAHAFVDHTLAPFMFASDGATAHGKRLGDWIVQKMGGEGEPWTDSGRWGMRQPSHHAAWYSKARDPSVRGEHFKLDDTRVWMRLHFWAARQCGLHEHTAFWNWYVQFIEHFIAVYERRAPRYAQEDAEWSAEDANIAEYQRNGNAMIDVIGQGR